jgi:hypothetical protein
LQKRRDFYFAFYVCYIFSGQVALRVCDLVLADMAAYEEGAHTPVVLAAVAAVRARFLAAFAHQVAEAVRIMKEDQGT